MERCSAITLASAMLGMHSMRPSSGEVASTLRTVMHNPRCRTCQVKVFLQCLRIIMLRPRSQLQPPREMDQRIKQSDWYISETVHGETRIQSKPTPQSNPIPPPVNGA